MTTLISPGLTFWSARTCRALAAANREIMNAITAVKPHGTSVTGIVPTRTPTPLLSSQSKVPSCSAPPRLPGSAASQPRTATPAQRIQLARAVAAPPTTAMTDQLIGGNADCRQSCLRAFFSRRSRVQ